MNIFSFSWFSLPVFFLFRLKLKWLKNGCFFAVHIDFMSLLSNVDSLGKLGAWLHGWHESNFGMARVGHVGPQNFGADQKKWQGQNFGFIYSFIYLFICLFVYLFIYLFICLLASTFKGVYKFVSLVQKPV